MKTLREALTALVREVKYHKAGIGSELRLRDELAYAEEALAGDDDEWIRVVERKPDDGQWVFCWRRGHHMRMFQHTGQGWRKEDGTSPRHALEYTHWRPLPPGPK